MIRLIRITCGTPISDPHNTPSIRLEGRQQSLCQPSIGSDHRLIMASYADRHKNPQSPPMGLETPLPTYHLPPRRPNPPNFSPPAPPEEPPPPPALHPRSSLPHPRIPFPCREGPLGPTIVAWSGEGPPAQALLPMGVAQRGENPLVRRLRVAAAAIRPAGPPSVRGRVSPCPARSPGWAIPSPSRGTASPCGVLAGSPLSRPPALPRLPPASGRPPSHPGPDTLPPLAVRPAVPLLPLALRPGPPDPDLRAGPHPDPSRPAPAGG